VNPGTVEKRYKAPEGRHLSNEPLNAIFGQTEYLQIHYNSSNLDCSDVAPPGLYIFFMLYPGFSCRFRGGVHPGLADATPPGFRDVIHNFNSIALCFTPTTPSELGACSAILKDKIKPIASLPPSTLSLTVY